MGKIFPEDDLMKEIISWDVIEKEDVQQIKIYATKKRFRKLVTIIEGLNKEKLNQTAKELKTRLACGGTTKDGLIILQGNHLRKIKQLLVDMDYPQESINVVPGLVR